MVPLSNLTTAETICSAYAICAVKWLQPTSTELNSLIAFIRLPDVGDVFRRPSVLLLCYILPYGLASPRPRSSPLPPSKVQQMLGPYATKNNSRHFPKYEIWPRFSFKSHLKSTTNLLSADDWSRFTALHGMQTRSSDENSVRTLSVRPSACQTRGLWQNGRKIYPNFYTMQKII